MATPKQLNCTHGEIRFDIRAGLAICKTCELFFLPVTFGDKLIITYEGELNTYQIKRTETDIAMLGRNEEKPKY